MKWNSLKFVLVFTLTVPAQLACSGCAVSDRKSSDQRPYGIRFRATVISVDYFANYEGKATITHFDPSFILILDVEATDPTDSQIELGRQAFAVHSLVHVFGPSEASADSPVIRPELWGKTMDFTLGRSENRWHSLRVVGAEVPNNEPEEDRGHRDFEPVRLDTGIFPR